MPGINTIAFDHIPDGADNAGSYLVSLGKYGISYVPSSANCYGGTNTDAKGSWMTTYAQPNGMGYLMMPITGYWDYANDRYFYHGFRYVLTYSNIGNLPSAYPLGWRNGASVYPLIALGDFAWVSGKEYYVEILIDKTTGKRTVWVDGVKIIDSVAIASVAQLTAASSFIWGGVGTNGGSFTFVHKYRDMYFVSDPDVGNQIGRQGPIIVVPLPVLSLSGSDWPQTPTALNASINTSTPQTGGLTIPASGQALDLVLDTAGLTVNSRIRGLNLVEGGWRQAGTSTYLGNKLVDGVNADASLANLSWSSDTGTYGTNLGTQRLALDATTWSKAKIDALKVRVTPALA